METYAIISENDKPLYLKDTDNKYARFVQKGKKISLLNGPYFQYYRNGNLNKTGNFALGEKQGEWQFYYESGKKLAEYNFQNGRYEGKQIEYYPTGVIKKISRYKKHLPHGKWEYYSKKGELKKIVYFKHGEKIKTQEH
jgi:antitoxin component YwqK of YwqJK toxin-antitoxin module